MNVQCSECPCVFVGIQPEQIPLEVTCQACGATSLVTPDMLRRDIYETHRMITKVWKWSAIIALAITLFCTLTIYASTHGYGRHHMTTGAILLISLMELVFWFLVLAFFLLALKYREHNPQFPAILSILLFPIIGLVGWMELRRYVRRGEAHLAHLASSKIAGAIVQ